MNNDYIVTGGRTSAKIVTHFLTEVNQHSSHCLSLWHFQVHKTFKNSQGPTISVTRPSFYVSQKSVISWLLVNRFCSHLHFAYKRQIMKIWSVFAFFSLVQISHTLLQLSGSQTNLFASSPKKSHDIKLSYTQNLN